MTTTDLQKLQNVEELVADVFALHAEAVSMLETLSDLCESGATTIYQSDDVLALIDEFGAWSLRFIRRPK